MFYVSLLNPSHASIQLVNTNLFCTVVSFLCCEEQLLLVLPGIFISSLLCTEVLKKMRFSEKMLLSSSEHLSSVYLEGAIL